jgi:nucleotide-binding universal stress UspA family protein
MRMLICTIGSKRRKSTLRFATEVAKALTGKVTLLGVVSEEKDKATLQDTLNKAAMRITELGITVRTRVETGSAENIVMAELEQETYDIVALGALAGKRSRRTFFATVGMRIVERAQSSVLLIKGSRHELSRVLICASGAGHGHLAIWAGASIACGAQAQATVLHVVDALPAMYAGLEQMEETLAELLQSDTEKARELKWAAQVVKAECDISELKLRRGIVTEEILREAEKGNYDLVVLGSSQASGGLVRALMGDVAREIANRADQPVLIVRPITQD